MQVDTRYRHTQRAVYVIAGLIVMALGIFFFELTRPDAQLWLVYVILLAVGVLFHSMTITLDDTRISWFFGPGFWRKSVSLSEIDKVRVVRNRWFYGWGVRFTPHGWLYNVSGLDGVELRLKTGRKVRLGSDEADHLANVIREQVDTKHTNPP